MAQPSTARALLEKLTSNRGGTFILGLIAGGVVMLLGMAAFGPRSLPAPAPAPRPALVCPPQPPVAKAQCPACPSPVPSVPVIAGAVQPAPATEVDAPPAVSAKDSRKARALAAAARRALMARQWKKAHRLAGEALRLDPGNAPAQRVRVSAGARLH